MTSNLVFRRLNIKSIDGNVGIGTIVPLNLLHIYSSNNNNYTKGILLENGANGETTIAFKNNMTNNSIWTIGLDTNSSNLFIGELKNINNPISTLAGIVITSNLNIGIGVTNPRAKLEVNGDILPSLCNVYNLGSSNYRFKDIYLSGNTIDLGGTKITRDDITGGINVLTSTGLPSDIKANSVYISNTLEFTNSSFVVKANGNLGIGTTSPTEKIQTNGNIYSTSQFLGSLNDSAGTPGYSFKNNSNTGIFHPTTNTIALSTNGIERMRIDSNGNVGIGTNDTSLGKLVVAGSIIPTTCNLYDLGTSNYRFRDLYLSGNTLYLGNASISSINDSIKLPNESIYFGDKQLYFNTTSNNLIFNNNNLLNTVPTILYSLQSNLVPDNNTSDNNWSFALSFSSNGDTLAVGVPLDTNANGSTTGSIYMYNRNINNWVLQQKIIELSGATNNRFGSFVTVSYDGNMLVAHGRISNKVYIYTRSGIIWSLITTINISNVCSALSYDKNTLAIGTRENQSIGMNAGSVYIYTRSGNSWTQQAYFESDNPEVFYLFGESISISSDGNILAVSEYSRNHVYIFKRNIATWSKETILTSTSSTYGNQFGYSVSISANGSNIAIGAPLHSNSKGTNAGSVYIFTYNNSLWSEQARLQATNGNTNDNFGTSVSLSADGNTLIVGSYLNDNQNGNNAGSSYIFTKNNNIWKEDVNIRAHDGNANDQYGRTVSISPDGSTFAVVADLDDSPVTNRGSTYIYKLSKITSLQNDYITSTNQFLGSYLDSANNPSYSFKDNSNTGVFHPKINTIALSTNGIERFRVDNNGNVGIGTTNPREKLEIGGHIIPSSCNLYDLGTPNLRFRDLYLSGNTINMEGNTLTTSASDLFINNVQYIPPGTIIYVAASTAPTGFLKANGSAISRSVYNQLFSRISTTFGAGDGSTTFTLPDLRGEFVRGWDDSRGADSGRAFGNFQDWSIENITGSIVTGHSFHPYSPNSANISGAIGFAGASGASSGGGSGSTYRQGFNFDASRVAKTSTETRPRNISLLACIKT